MDKPAKVKPSWRPRITEWLKAIPPGDTYRFPAECLSSSIRRTAVRLGMRVSVRQLFDGTFEVTRTDKPNNNHCEQTL